MIALAYLHSQHIIHRDLKPSNLLLALDRGVKGSSEYGVKGSMHVKLGDLGLARPLREGASADGKRQLERRPSGGLLYQPATLPPTDAVRAREHSMRMTNLSLTTGVGTYYYLSPEARNQGQYDERTDIYACGVILFEMWTSFGSEMERCRTLDALQQRGEYPRDFVRSCPLQYELVSQMIATDPAARPTALELLRQVPIQLEGEGPSSEDNDDEERGDGEEQQQQVVEPRMDGVGGEMEVAKGRSLLRLSFGQAMDDLGLAQEMDGQELEMRGAGASREELEMRGAGASRTSAHNFSMEESPRHLKLKTQSPRHHSSSATTPTTTSPSSSSGTLGRSQNIRRASTTPAVVEPPSPVADELLLSWTHYKGQRTQVGLLIRQVAALTAANKRLHSEAVAHRADSEAKELTIQRLCACLVAHDIAPSDGEEAMPRRGDYFG
jgi:serine/threonine protein kinase